jgi:predicted Zn-dependent peptidase/ribonuclease PH
MLHYNFPPFSVGEVGRLGTGRREIGHGNLARRAIEEVLPSKEAFPYTVRVVSEVLESNGSSSMATVCAGTLSLLAAGVPLKMPVAGIAMGLITEGERYAVLSDILGDEDHLGDMDFKVAGSTQGITGFQMDIKIAGVSTEILTKALAQAKRGRLHILSVMEKTISTPAAEISEFAPKVVSAKIDVDKIGAIIGPGGKNIKALCEQFGVKINVDDDGSITIYGSNQKAAYDAKDAVMGIAEDPETGRMYDGVVKRVMDFGAFIEILPGKEGLCHISRLSKTRVDRVTDVVHEGDKVKVKLLEVDRLGRLNRGRVARGRLFRSPRGVAVRRTAAPLRRRSRQGRRSGPPKGRFPEALGVIVPVRLPRGAALAAEIAEGARSFAVGFWFPLGSRHEAPQERGFVHFVEHMAFKGTARRGAEDISREIDRVGGYLNAFTDRDSICLHCLVPAKEWRLALDVLADMAFSSLFKEEDFERERDVIVSEILAARDDPDECSHEELLAAIWPGDPMSRKIAGEPEDLARATREELYSFYRKRFGPSSLLVTAAGPVPPREIEREMGAILERIEAGVEAGPPTTEAVPSFTTANAYKGAAMGQVHYFEAAQLDPPFRERDYYVLAALNGAVGEASSSRLFQALREREGLCYSVYSAFSMGRSECLWLASANVSLKELPRLAAGMAKELDAVAEKGLTDVECGEAVTRLAGSLEVALDDADFRMRRIGRQVLFRGAALEPAEALALVSSLEAGEIAAMARLLLGRPRARFAYGKRSARAAGALGLDEAPAAEAARRG